jgi:hypothetical protein
MRLRTTLSTGRAETGSMSPNEAGGEKWHTRRDGSRGKAELTWRRMAVRLPAPFHCFRAAHAHAALAA